MKLEDKYGIRTEKISTRVGQNVSELCFFWERFIETTVSYRLSY